MAILAVSIPKALMEEARRICDGCGQDIDSFVAEALSSYTGMMRAQAKSALQTSGTPGSSRNCAGFQAGSEAAEDRQGQGASDEWATACNGC